MSLDNLWVLSGFMPCGAEETEAMSAPPGARCLSVCVMGTHLPQLYRNDEISVLADAAMCESLGLCPQCWGRGTPASMRDHVAPHIDEVEPCGSCGGTGRTVIRVTLERSDSGLTGHLEILPHAYIPPVKGSLQTCLACGSDQDSEPHASTASRPV